LKEVSHPMKIPLILALLFQLHSLLYAQFNLLETDQHRLIYFGGAQSYMINHTARCVENSINFHTSHFNYVPSEKVTILLHDFSDYGNASAISIPKNSIFVSISPFNYAYETVIPNERMNWIMNHEVLHLVTSDGATSRDKFFRKLFFGKVLPSPENPVSMVYGYFTNPRMYAPSWYYEGTAVFYETWMAGGLGRAQGAYDEMVFRTWVLEGTKIYDIVGLESEVTKVDFLSGVNYYLYGTRFISYLAFQYGPENIKKWVSRSEGSEAYFESQFMQIFGLTLEKAWDNWIQWEIQYQNKNLDVITSKPVTEYSTITNDALGSVSKSYYDPTTGKLYAAINYPGQVAHIASIDMQSGNIEKICDVKGAAFYYVTSLIYDQSSKTLFYTTDNYEHRDLVAVHTESGWPKMLLEDIRTGDLAFNTIDKSIWGVRHFNGISTLVRIPYPYEEWNQIYSLDYGQDLYDINISPDGTSLVGALARINGEQLLIRFDINKLLNQDFSIDTLYNFEGSIPANFSYSPDGKFLYGSSYYSGVSNIYRWDNESRDMSPITNCKTGYFNPKVYKPDSLIALRYRSNGFQPVIIPSNPSDEFEVKAIEFLGTKVIKKHPILADWMISSPYSVNLDSAVIYTGEYSALKNLGISSIYPIIEGYKDFAAFGLQINISDPIRLHSFDLTGSYSPNDYLKEEEKIHIKANYKHLNWKFYGNYNKADFYDLFGPTKMSRKGYSLGMKYEKSLIYDQPRMMDYAVSLAYHGGLERLPDFQNIFSPFEELFTGQLQFNYKHLSSSIGAVTHEKGYKWTVESNSYYVNQTFIPRIHTDFDFGIALPINNSSIWFRTSAGYSFSSVGGPYANFYFGGFGNNWIDHLSSQRFREYYSFPGVELNAIAGKNYGKLLIEWTLPPIRFRRMGLPILYNPWVRPALFTTGLVTNMDNFWKRRIVYNIGGQLDFKLITLSRLHFTFSIGYAIAIEHNRHLSKEFMVSLKIL
jgi:hypothetical protein